MRSAAAAAAAAKSSWRRVTALNTRGEELLCVRERAIGHRFAINCAMSLLCALSTAISAAVSEGLLSLAMLLLLEYALYNMTLFCTEE